MCKFYFYFHFDSICISLSALYGYYHEVLLDQPASISKEKRSQNQKDNGVLKP